MSLACQNSIDVQPPVGALSPCSLFMLLVADSGEGKTPADHYFTKPIRDFEENEAKKAEHISSQQQASRSTWTIVHKEIEAALKKNRKKSLSTNTVEKADLLDREFDILQQKLQDHLSNEPLRQKNCKLIFNNITPAKIARDFHENWPSACLISDEAGSLFRGEAMRDLGLLNQLWDGSPLSVDRVSSPSFKVRDARLTISLMVQGQILQNYLKKGGIEARDIGFIARCLVAYPVTAKGSRMLNGQNQSWHYLTAFQQRVTEILAQDKLEVDQGRQTRPVLAFSQTAKNHWIGFRNNVESNLNPGGYFSDVDDGASKITNNLARMAALFHFFEGCQGEISYETITCAGCICEWYINEFKRLFTKNPEIPMGISDTYELEQSLIRWCQNHPGHIAIKKCQIVQYCPNPLRKDPHRRDYALNALVLQDKIRIRLYGKTQWVEFNPQFFPVNISPYCQPPMMQNPINNRYLL